MDQDSLGGVSENLLQTLLQVHEGRGKCRGGGNGGGVGGGQEKGSKERAGRIIILTLGNGHEHGSHTLVAMDQDSLVVGLVETCCKHCYKCVTGGGGRRRGELQGESWNDLLT